VRLCPLATVSRQARTAAYPCARRLESMGDDGNSWSQPCPRASMHRAGRDPRYCTADDSSTRRLDSTSRIFTQTTMRGSGAGSERPVGLCVHISTACPSLDQFCGDREYLSSGPPWSANGQSSRAMADVGGGGRESQRGAGLGEHNDSYGTRCAHARRKMIHDGRHRGLVTAPAQAAYGVWSRDRAGWRPGCCRARCAFAPIVSIDSRPNIQIGRRHRRYRCPPT